MVKKILIGLVVLVGLIIGASRLFMWSMGENAKEEKRPQLNQVQFDRCMEGRSILDKGAIKSCENQQFLKSK